MLRGFLLGCVCVCLQLAEKRKTLVDEMSIRGQETAEEQKKKMEEAQEKLRVREGGMIFS